MNLTLAPKTKLGRRAFGLSAIMLLVSYLLYLLTEQWNLIQSDLVVSAVATLSIAGLVAASVMGLAALFRQKDLSILVILSITAGILVLAILAANL
ncbi:hypothetical protein [Proteiniclasticum sp. QWL-01]|uniref:hypothetical protein n=1 Tax=Proteiniclasticum sp. QWL-01 TaxID=3036945 RepID=UPI002410D43E|nr:hypothetical protein [Proteiniclasticum sp. QWL-01]WFF73883.1 hypothetical protein P6M73_05395 [Proteiniclasticum sp. QWL-01]